MISVSASRSTTLHCSACACRTADPGDGPAGYVDIAVRFQARDLPFEELTERAREMRERDNVSPEEKLFTYLHAGQTGSTWRSPRRLGAAPA